MEGIDLLPFVTGDQGGVPHEALYWRSGTKWSVLAADGTKQVQDNDSDSPQLFFLPDDVSETNDLIASQPERSKALQESWKRWDEENVPCRMLGYIDYHKQRDRFFMEAIPKDATESGYEPTIKGNFK